MATTNDQLKERNETLTALEVAEGWHWCPDWDYLLVGPGMEEATACMCDWTVTSNPKENDGVR